MQAIGKFNCKGEKRLQSIDWRCYSATEVNFGGCVAGTERLFATTFLAKNARAPVYWKEHASTNLKKKYAQQNKIICKAILCAIPGTKRRKNRWGRAHIPATRPYRRFTTVFFSFFFLRDFIFKKTRSFWQEIWMHWA